MSQSEVARRFSVSRQTVYNYLKLAAGQGLGAKRPPGRVRKLSAALEQAVLARAEQQDTTLQEHCDWLLAEHGVALDPSNLWRLFNRAGVSWKKSLQPRQRDEAARKSWLENIRSHDVPALVFLDETGVLGKAAPVLALNQHFTGLAASGPARRLA